MESLRVHFVRIAGDVRGPMSVEQMRDLGTVNVITLESEIALSVAGPWAPITTLAICGEVFPAKAALGFKSTKFEEINHASMPVVEVDALKDLARRPPASLRGREVVVSPLVARVPRDVDPANDVQAMVLEVGRRVAANTPETVLPPPRRSYRWVWFAALSFVGTAGILSIPLFYPDRRVEEFTVSILGSWIVMFNGLLVAVLLIDRRLRADIQNNKAKFEQLK